MFKLIFAFWITVLCANSYAVEFVYHPTLTMNPNGVTPLAGQVEFITDVPTKITLVIIDISGTRYVKFSEFKTSHFLPLLGVISDREYSLQVKATSVNLQSVMSKAILFSTPALPLDFPTIDVSDSIPEDMEPGLTLLDLYNGSRQSPIKGRAMVLNSSGEVVWFSSLGTNEGNVRNFIERLPNGNLRYLASRAEANYNEDTVIVSDLLGNLISSTEMIDPGVGLHHDLISTPEGTFMSLTRIKTSVDNFPTSDTDLAAPKETAYVRDEPVVEFNPDGTVVAIWPLVDLIDPTRIGYDSLRPSAAGFDSFHTNAVFYDASDDSILVSARHQDAIFKYSRASGDLIWILGNHLNWSPEFHPFLLQPTEDLFDWQYHQHAMMPTPDGTLLLFDNGNRRTSPFDGKLPLADSETSSRAVEYKIDETLMTVEKVREFVIGGSSPVFSGTRGDADWLPGTGNILATASDVSFEGGIASKDLGFGTRHTRIIEYATNPEREVFDVRLFSPEENSRIHVYRSDRIPGLYPASVETEGPLEKLQVKSAWIETDTCFEIDNDGDNLISEDSGNVPGDDDGDGQIDEDPSECAGDSYGGTPLANDGAGTYSFESGLQPKVLYSVTSTSVHFNSAAAGTAAFYNSCMPLLELDTVSAGPVAFLVYEHQDGTLQAIHDFSPGHPVMGGTISEQSTIAQLNREFLPGEVFHLYVRMREIAETTETGSSCHNIGTAATASARGVETKYAPAILSFQ
jgi:arylsulfate sulfotransferase